MNTKIDPKKIGITITVIVVVIGVIVLLFRALLNFHSSPSGSTGTSTYQRSSSGTATTTFIWVEPGQWYDIPIVQDEICRFRPVKEDQVDWFMMVNNQSSTIITMSHTRTGKEGENRIDPVGVTNISVAIPGNGQRSMFQVTRQKK